MTPFMSRAGAIATAQNAARRFGKIFVVYRCTHWPEDVYRAIAVDADLPAGAQLFERVTPEPAPVVAAPTGQGGLF